MTLISRIKKAIKDVNIKELYKLKEICDKLHDGQTVPGYTAKDLPSDELYEDMKETIKKGEQMIDKLGSEAKKNAAYRRKDTGQVVNEGTKFVKGTTIPELWMGSIPKPAEYVPIDDVLFLPKFDGVSGGLKFTRNSKQEFELEIATTRGSDVAYDRKTTNIKNKLDKIIGVLTTKFNTSEFKFNDDTIPMKNINQINLRGEIVLKDKDSVITAPASVVAGKINGKEKVWEDYYENIEFMPVEIMRLHDNEGKLIRPTQLEALKFFKTLGYYNYEEFAFATSSTSDKPVITTDTVKNIYEHFNNVITNPLDGVVYCSEKWQYPYCKAETMDSVYGKYAWKPTSKISTVLRGIEYNIARDGKINLELTYDPVNINGKNYGRAKTSIKQLLILDENTLDDEICPGMNIGSNITVKLMGDISPMVVDYETDETINGYKLIKNCPWCNSELLFDKKKTQMTLKCLNKNCIEIIKQKMKNFLTTLSIKGVAEKKLDKLEKITLEEIEKQYFKKSSEDFRNKIKEANTNTFLVAIGVGGVTQVDKFLTKHGLANHGVLPIMKNIDEIVNICDNEYANDTFVTEIIGYICDNLL